MKWLFLFLPTFALALTSAPRGPAEYPFSTYAWVLGLSLWGGLVAHMRKYSDGKRPSAPIATAFVDITGSGLAGLLVFLGCAYLGLDPLLTAVIVGISGHMGARALFLLEKTLVRKYPQLLGTKPGDLGER